MLLRNLLQMAPGFEFEDRDKVRRVDQCFILGTLRSVEVALVRPIAKHLDPCLDRWIDTKGNQAPGRFRIEAKA